MPSIRKPRTGQKNVPSAARIHPNQRAGTEGLNKIAAALYGPPAYKQAISYYTPELIQCTLPHSDPKKRDWIRTSGGHTLIISSGIDESGEPFGIPYGSFPRLVLAYIITRVVKTEERRIDFKSYFRSFLREVGYEARPNVRQGKALHNNLERLFNATITYNYKDEAVRARQQFTVAPKSVLFWNYQHPDQGGLWDSYIEISEEFRASILGAPVPLRTDMLSALKKSPLAIDLYMWISYRLFALHRNNEESLTLSYGSLQTQFGTSIASDNYRNFRHELRLAFEKVKKQWEKLAAADGKPHALHCEMEETSITLYKSPLLIAQAAPKKTPGQGILTSRQFNEATLRKASQLAGNWDLNVLTSRYFAWLDEKGIIPDNPSAHFLDFVRSHYARNA